MALALTGAACDGEPSTSSTGPPDTGTTAPAAVCERGSASVTWDDVDLDGDGRTEAVGLDAGSDGLEVVVCAAEELVGAVALPEDEAELWGYVDLDDDGRTEILVRTATDRRVLRAVTFTLRGVALTDLAAERWLDASAAAGRPFEGAGYECDDIDDDGTLELLVVAYRPAEALEHLDVARVDLDGTDVREVGVDSFETGADAARSRWDREACTTATTTAASVVHGANGWGLVDAGGAFESDGDVVLTGAAHVAAAQRFVAVGYEQANLLLGDSFETRAAIWWSPDGVDWRRAALRHEEGELRAVVAREGGTAVVAVGRVGPRGAVWVSDDGERWRLVEVPPARPGGRVVLRDVVDAADGLVAVGYEAYAPDGPGAGEDRDPAVWRSSDAREWTRVDDPAAFGEPGYQPNVAGGFNGELVGVAVDGDGRYVAVGSASGTDQPAIDYPPEEPAAWTSTDGQTWRRHPAGAGVQLRGVAATASGFVAHGVTELSPTSDAVVSTSPDGTAWTRVPGPFAGTGPVDGLQTINAVLAVPGVGVVAVGADEQEFEARGGAAVWWAHQQPDVWTREAHADTVFTALDDAPTATMTGAAWDGEQLVVVGFSGRELELPNGGTGCCGFRPAVWLWPTTTPR